MRTELERFRELHIACDEFRRFDEFTGQQLNGGKCLGFGTTKHARKMVANLLPKGGCVVYHLLSLGFVVHSTRKGQQAYANARCERQFPMLRRIVQFPLSKEEKLKHISIVVVPAMPYGVFTSFPAWPLLQNLRPSILNAVFTTQQKLREPHLLVSVGYAQHRVDPTSAVVYNALLQLRQAVFQCELLRNSWDVVCEAPSSKRHGPLSVLHRLCEFLGWSPSPVHAWTWERVHDVLLSAFQHRTSYQHEVRRSVRYVVVQGVHRRKDAAGLLGVHLDYHACTYLLRGSEAGRARLLSKFPDFTPVSKWLGTLTGQLRQAVSGSTRTADRLHSSGLWDDDRCPVCCDREEPVRLFSSACWQPRAPFDAQVDFESDLRFGFGCAVFCVFGAAS